MGYKMQGAKNRVIAIQKEKRPWQNSGCRLTGKIKMFQFSWLRLLIFSEKHSRPKP